MATIVTIGLIWGVILIVSIIWQYTKIKRLLNENQELRSLTKSQQVKFGKTFEHFVPFTADFPANKENTIFLGMPIDFIAFEENCIKFIECKTGQSQLSSKQKHIKQLIEGRNVEFHELHFENDHREV